MSKFFDLRGWQKVLSVSVSVALSLVVVAFVADASSTISTNISTEGTLTVSGAVAASSTMQVTGATIHFGAVGIGGITAPSSGLEVTGTASSSAIVVGGGTSISRVQKGVCLMIISEAIAATSTRNWDCAVTGVVSTDSVFAQTSTTTPVTSGTLGYQILGVSASSTAGFITFKVANNTGAAGTPSAGFASTTYLILR